MGGVSSVLKTERNNICVVNVRDQSARNYIEKFSTEIEDQGSLYPVLRSSKGKAVLLQAWSGPEGSRKFRFPDFVTTAQDGSRLSVLSTGRLYPQEILLVLISVRG